MSILVDDSNKTACRAAEAGLQQKNCAALVRPAGTGKGCIVWELLDAHPEMRVLWVVSCAARLELRRALTKRLGRTLGGRVRLMSCEQLAVQNALGWVAEHATVLAVHTRLFHKAVRMLRIGAQLLVL